MYAYTYIYTYAYTYICMYIYIYIHIYIYTHIYIYIYTCMHLLIYYHIAAVSQESSGWPARLLDVNMHLKMAITPNLPTNIVPTNIARVKLSGKTLGNPYGPGNSTP